MSTRTSPKYVSPAQLAAELGLTDRTVRRWIAEGKLHAVRFSARVIRIDRAEVERLISEASA
ncbi:DNA binding domain, excisionase family [Gordonia polyisoprenivorans VH2]|uniref:DNA binding domain, excisionase family n=1 Tax=Gordonia polyisoprenivorans (strain DSM 44266 / VH2) TaxID=1112204 RepID=H6N4L8_GORPV|nr:helix-turn-helix domain-containing protein [Gordonia polyisoprenivorans]AFA73600.1 DNA binding domain, excisionase family [Gordonia polyisoprenivorans VH2]